MWTKKQLEALRAGASIEEVRAMAGAAADPLDEVDAGAEAGAEDEDEEEDQVLTIDLTNTAAVEEVLGKLQAANEALATELEASQAQVAELEGAVADLTESDQKAKAEAQVYSEQVEKMKPAIMGMIKQRGLVLGAVTPDEYEDTDTMLEAYDKLETKFKEKFRAGRQTLPTKTVDEPAHTKGFDSRTLAEMRAINIPA